MFDPYDCLVPIFIETVSPNRLSQIGSAIFAEFDSERYLLTAAHVSDQRKFGSLLAPTEDGLSFIEGHLIGVPKERLGGRHKDLIDISYFRLDDIFAEKLSHHFSPISPGDCMSISTALELETCSVSGFPASRAEKNGDILGSPVFSFSGHAANLSQFQSLDLSPTVNIIVNFSRKGTVYPETGQAFPTPGLKGISGGGIFAWPKGWTTFPAWSDRKLVGIVHTYKEREGLIIGTTIDVMLSTISYARKNLFQG